MEAFLKRGATYLVEKWGWAYWSKQKAKFVVSVTESAYRIRGVLSWQYIIQVSDKVYKQVVGIPKGTNCAPLLANLFLIRCEYEFQVYERPYEITS